MTRRLRFHATNSRTYEAAQFTSGQVCISHPRDPSFPGSFSLYGDIAHPLRTSPVLRNARIEYIDPEETP